MCGISGRVRTTAGPTDDVIGEQIRRLAHRGPDAEGSFRSEHGVIAQNRLAIIDLVDGDPPIATEDGRLGVVLNGEIYNFAELRRELVDAGHDFASHGDTEVLAHLLEDHEPAEVARRLNGMFAFAALDRRSGRLVLARDRFGKKPLYYAATKEAFVFGSELKAVLADPAVHAELEPRAIPAYLTFGYVPTPLTFFRGVLSIPPGHVLVLDPGDEPHLERYWRLPIPGADPVSRVDVEMDTAAREVRRLLERAVERRLIADVPVGAFLSGGIDSSAIVGLMAQIDGTRVPTFSVGFEDRDGFDERPYARAVAERHGTDHHEYVVHPDATELMDELVWHHDQPFGDSSAIPTYLLSQVTGRDVKVALSGDGGDEVFGGYERFAAALAAERLSRLPPLARTALATGLHALPASALGGRADRALRFARSADLGLPDALRSWVSYVDEPTRTALLDRADPWAIDDFRERWATTAGGDPLDRILRLNLETYLVDDLLVKADRMSMAHGLEVRSPFLDRDLVDYAFRLPPKTKVRGLALKRVLKHAVADLLPEGIADRRKRGFGVPLDRWFREDLAGYVEATLGSPDASVRCHLAGPALDRLLAEHRSGTRDHGHALWALLTLEVFLRKWSW